MKTFVIIAFFATMLVFSFLSFNLGMSSSLIKDDAYCVIEGKERISKEEVKERNFFYDPSKSIIITT